MATAVALSTTLAPAEEVKVLRPKQTAMCMLYRLEFYSQSNMSSETDCLVSPPKDTKANPSSQFCGCTVKEKEKALSHRGPRALCPGFPISHRLYKSEAKPGKILHVVRCHCGGSFGSSVCPPGWYVVSVLHLPGSQLTHCQYHE